MERRLSLVTLGVSSVAASRAFYERLGMVASGASQEGVAFFQLGGAVLALYGRAALAEDAGVADTAPTGFSGVTLAQNLTSREAVDLAYARALAAGATSLRPPAPAFWGGYTCYVADPDGHAWELAHNPFFAVDDDGQVTLPP